MNDQRTLRQLQDELRRTVAELVDPIPRTVIRDDQTTTTHVAPSLIEQLRQALAHGGETGKAGGSSVGEPLRLAAADLMRKLERESAELHYNAMVADADPVSRLRATAAIASRWAEVDRVAWVVAALRRWTERIRDLIDPPRQLHLTAACPACGAGMVWREDSERGEVVQVPALHIDGTNGCVCLACRHTWPPANLELLSQVLEQEQARTPRPRLQSGATGNVGRPGTHPSPDDELKIEDPDGTYWTTRREWDRYVAGTDKIIGSVIAVRYAGLEPQEGTS